MQADFYWNFLNIWFYNLLQFWHFASFLIYFCIIVEFSTSFLLMLHDCHFICIFFVILCIFLNYLYQFFCFNFIFGQFSNLWINITQKNIFRKEGSAHTYKPISDCLSWLYCSYLTIASDSYREQFRYHTHEALTLDDLDQPVVKKIT